MQSDTVARLEMVPVIFQRLDLRSPGGKIVGENRLSLLEKQIVELKEQNPQGGLMSRLKIKRFLFRPHLGGMR